MQFLVEGDCFCLPLGCFDGTSDGCGAAACRMRRKAWLLTEVPSRQRQRLPRRGKDETLEPEVT